MQTSELNSTNFLLHGICSKLSGRQSYQIYTDLLWFGPYFCIVGFNFFFWNLKIYVHRSTWKYIVSAFSSSFNSNFVPDRYPDIKCLTIWVKWKLMPSVVLRCSPKFAMRNKSEQYSTTHSNDNACIDLRECTP